MYTVHTCMKTVCTCMNIIPMCMYLFQTCTYTFVITSGAWHEVLSEFPHSKISRTLCRRLCAFFKISLGLFPGLIREVFLKDVKKINCILLQFRHLWLWNAWLARRDIPIHALNENFYNLVTGISNVRQFVQTWACFSGINSPIDEYNLLYACMYIIQPCIYYVHTNRQIYIHVCTFM